MKEKVEKKNPEGIVDHIALGIATFGVGYIPGAPGTYGSIVGVAIYLGVFYVPNPLIIHGHTLGTFLGAVHWTSVYFLLAVFVVVGIWASSRAIPLLGRGDPQQVVVDEVLGQLIALLFVPYVLGWPFILAGFLLFRLFDIVKPYPCRALERLPRGIGICADDIMAGIYAGICLAIARAVTLAI